MNQLKPARSFPRRLLRHLVRFLLVSAVLLGPNLVFFGRWDYPDQNLPAIPTDSDDHVSAPALPPELARDLLQELPEYGISVAVMGNSGKGAARKEAQEAAYALARR